MIAGIERFPRSLQWDSYSCGAHSTYVIAQYFGINCTYKEVKTAVKTAKDGTDESLIIRFLRHYKLRVKPFRSMSFAQLRQALIGGCVILVHLDGDHFSVVYGTEGNTVLLSDPSITRQFGRRCTLPYFKQRWARCSCRAVTVRQP